MSVMGDGMLRQSFRCEKSFGNVITNAKEAW